MRYLIYDTESAALADEAIISARGLALLTARGRTVDGAGLVAINAATGAPDASAAHTTHWATPRQRADGKWIVRHPEAMVGATADEVAAAMSGLSPTIEEFDPAWFPSPPTP